MKRPLVFTNGCFDVLHPGHIELLREARQFGEALVVAVNSDASVRTLKGPTRPINRLEARMSALRELRCVDAVFSFDTELQLVALVRFLVPDLLVKGGDYAGVKLAGANWAAKQLILARRGDYSTTGTLTSLAGAGT